MRFIAFILLLLPTLVTAQGAATLVADSVIVEGDNRLIATGNIEVFYNGTRLSAARIIYDQSTDRLIIEGPIFVQSPDGTILTADRASLDPRLENGVLRGARLVLDQQLQLAANQIDRIEGRYSQLYKVAVTSCAVCGGQAPLWEIRAERVIHDTQEQQLYFDNATFRLRGVPIFWVPRMRLPDPSNSRATGLLLPRIRRSNLLGTGLRLPYFITLGDHRDLTLIPYISAQTTTLEARYRQAFLNGSLNVQAAASQDTLRPDQTRSYLFAEGHFDLKGDYQLTFNVEAVSDPAYLLDYGYSDKDRLDSHIGIVRVDDDSLFSANLTYYQTLRDDENNAALPPLVGEISFEQRLQPRVGGVLTLTANADTIFRYGTGISATQRDVSRFGAGATWQNSWVLPAGVVASAKVGLLSDYYLISDDANYPGTLLRTTPSANVTLRWPLHRTTPNGTVHVIEPTVALAWSHSSGDSPPNEDSTRVELDQANLLSLNHFPGQDAVENGFRGAIGVTWTRLGNNGVNSTLSFGRMLQQDVNPAFTPSSGLDSNASDWLLSGQLSLPQGLTFDGRTLFDDTLSVTLAAAQLNWNSDQISLSAAYIWQRADALESRDDNVSEWTLDTTMQLADAWAVSFDTRYDIIADSPTRAGLGVEWRNECVTVDFSVSRRYTSSTTVAPSTNYGLTVSLNGFSTGRATGGANTHCIN